MFLNCTGSELVDRCPGIMFRGRVEPNAKGWYTCSTHATHSQPARVRPLHQGQGHGLVHWQPLPPYRGIAPSPSRSTVSAAPGVRAHAVLVFGAGVQPLCDVWP